jgi:ABC-type branched-subunit amino acid transport system substrate-binding protein
MGSRGSRTTAFVQEWRQSKDRQVVEFSYESGARAETVFGPAEKAEAQVVLLAVGPRDFVRLREAAGKREAALLYGGAEHGSEALAGEGPTAYLATVWCAEGLSERGKDFVRKYEQEFRKAPGLAAAQAYDGTRLLFEALAKAGSSLARLREHLAGVDGWETVTGPLSLKAHRTRRPVFVVKLEGAEPKRARTFPREGDARAEK